MTPGSNPRYYYLMLLISPLIGVYLAVRNLRWEGRRKVLILAITIFGATIILNDADGARLRAALYNHYVGLSFSDWFYELTEILQFNTVDGLKGDVYSHFFSYLIGHIMGIPSQYFLFVSFIFAYFYIGSLSKVLRWDRSKSRSNVFWAFIIIFIAYRSIDTIQSVRTWTGAWLLFYSVYHYHATQKTKYLWLMLMAPLCHVAYFIIALPAYAVIFVKRLSPKLFIPFYLCTFLISVNPKQIIGQLQTTELGASKVDGYYREDNAYDEDRVAAAQRVNFYQRIGKGWALPNAPHFTIGALLILGMVSSKRLTKLEMSLLSTGILMATGANLGSFVNVFYNRTMGNAGIYILAVTVSLLIRGELIKGRGLD
ncbi:MAG: EpsG family protein, partial [Bacteroidota bacterium]